MEGVELIDPEVEENVSSVEVIQPGQWITPGIYLAQNVFKKHLVRFVGERYESDYLQVIVVLSDDPEELLDYIFSLEQEMFKKFGKLRFDVRIRVVPSIEKIDLIKNSSVIHIDENSNLYV